MNKISPVSFGSTFKILSKENSDKAYHKALEIKPFEIDPNAQDIFIRNKDGLERTIIVNDWHDDLMESLLKLCQVNFNKKTNKEIFSESNILSKLKPINPDNFINMPNPVKINAEKLDEKLKEISIYRVTKDYKDFYNNIISNKLKAGMTIIAPEIDKQIADEALNKLKVDELGLDDVDIRYLRGKPDINFVAGFDTYEFLKDFGMKEIPFIMRNTSYKVASEMGLTE